jgi:hypothetical protein
MLHLQKSDERDASPCIHAPAPHDTIYKLKIAVEDSVTAPQISIGLPRGGMKHTRFGVVPLDPLGIANLS